MRLWHQQLLPYLPRQQLLGQHRECCALRGKAWGKKHSVVDYVFTHDPAYLVAYHMLVMAEMRRRGYKPDPIWGNINYRGKVLGDEPLWCNTNIVCDLVELAGSHDNIIYPEHDDEYLSDCLDNLRSKGIGILELAQNSI